MNEAVLPIAQEGRSRDVPSSGDGVEARHVDILVLADCRFPGGTSTALASEIAIQAQAGYSTGLLQIKGPILKAPHTIHPEIRALIDRGACELLTPGQPCTASLTLIHHPQLFTHPPRLPLAVKGDLVLLVVHHPPHNAVGIPYYDIGAIEANLRLIFNKPVVWAPVGPRVREQLEASNPRPPLLEFDWHNLLDFDRYGGARSKPNGAIPIIGRHARPDPLKWPASREEILEIYPDDRTIAVRILGAGEFLTELMGTIPANWTVLPFDLEAPPDFLETIDFFVFFHHRHWVEAFGRTILEALAAGCVAILPPAFEPLFGKAACYAEPADVVELVRTLHQNPEAYAKQSRLGLERARRAFGKEAHLLRLQDLGVWPKPKVKPSSASLSSGTTPTVLFFTSNGIGLGHLTRLLAIACRLPTSCRSVFVTLSQAMRVVQEAGYPAEYLPFHVYLEVPSDAWNRQLRFDLDEIFKFYAPAVVVFDGNMPYQGLVDALQAHPDILPVWVRRGFWRHGTNKAALKRENSFHMIIEPGDLAGAIDDGPTRTSRQRTKDVAPIRYLDRGDCLACAEAVAELELDSHRLRVLVQLGSGNNFDLSATIAVIADFAAARPDVQFVMMESPIQNETASIPAPLVVRRSYPISRYFNAFDAAISAVGYNSFHEFLLGGCPTLFVPNEHPSMDDQLRRSRYAQSGGLALVARHGDPYELRRKLAILLEPGFRQRTKLRLSTLDQTNGAVQAALMIEELARTIRADIPA